MSSLRFFFGSTFFVCISFCLPDDAKGYFRPDPGHTHADTVRVDSIAAEIDGMTNLIFGSTFSKNFICGDSTKTGKVSVDSYKRIREVEVQHCGDDHSGTTKMATFLKGKLICFFEHSGSQSLDMSAQHDSTKAFPTVDVRTIAITYIRNNRAIKKEVLNETVFNSTGKKETKSEILYYFDNTGEDFSARAKEMQTWIRFADSKKTYAEYFRVK